MFSVSLIPSSFVICHIKLKRVEHIASLLNNWRVSVMSILQHKETPAKIYSQSTNTEFKTYMTCKYVTELLLSQQIIARGEHLPHMLSTVLKLVS